MEIKIKYHSEDIEKVTAIEKGDWIDQRAAEDVHLEPMEFKIISLGVSMKLPEGYEAHLCPRSSTFKKWGIIQTNSPGIVDNSYSGDGDVWGLPVVALRSTDIHKGDRICQFRLVEKMPTVVFSEADHLSDVNRGGFGSTGEN